MFGCEGADPRDNLYRGYCYNKRPKFKINLENVALDIYTKKAALKASSSVVALLSYSGEQELTQCCGVINENNASNRHTVLTSANLIQCRTEQNVLEDKLADSLKVIQGSSLDSARLHVNGVTVQCDGKTVQFLGKTVQLCSLTKSHITPPKAAGEHILT
ncbi:hypothetical protein KIW84_014059 [Lathyrus oleraceus]|uniref:Uncharacterized protein n=1 Tax=Pisum sativum TaxID=3888 RepID=A0A9D5GZ11_PEA|nr:hypothetical protein KIW84_014059 [Pisum sativum]